jgi:chromosome segregation ATPase
MALLPLLQALSPSQESHWVLFREGTVIVRGSAADEEQAKKARAGLTGDLLWFQVDGKTYITQDKDVMNRIQSALVGTPQATQGIAQLQSQLEQLGVRRNDQGRAIRELQSSLEQITRSLPNNPQEVEVQQKDLEAIRAQAARLQALSAQLEANAALMSAQLEAVRRNVALGGSREVEILRGAVREGKAQIVP